MIEIILFAEDVAHEQFLAALLHRIGEDNGIAVSVRPRSVRGGRGRVVAELRVYLRGLQRGDEPPPDLLVVATDANCKTVAARRRELDDALEGFRSLIPAERVVYAIPDPHVERWLLLDSAAFRSAVGKGCQAPDFKCERDRYKRLLADAVRDAGLTPILGGIEHTEDIVRAMDLPGVQDRSLRALLDDVLGALKRASQT